MLVTAGTPKHFLIAEQQLKPILAYMKAQIVQSYVFIEEKDFYRKEIITDDVFFRIARLVEDTVVLSETYARIREAKKPNTDSKEGFYSSRIIPITLHICYPERS